MASITPMDQVSLLPVTEPTVSTSKTDEEIRQLHQALINQASHEFLSQTCDARAPGVISDNTTSSSSAKEEEYTYGYPIAQEKDDLQMGECKLEKRWEKWLYLTQKSRPHAIPARTASPPSPSPSSPYHTRAIHHLRNLIFRILLAIRHTITGEYSVPDDAVLRNTRLFFSLCETSCQIDCIRVAHLYQTCRTSDLASECTFLKAARPPLDLHFLSNPSTTVFVFTCLAYGLFASTQFSFNRVDRFQRLLLMAGLVVAFCMSLPSEMSEGRISAWRFGMYVTAALGVSTSGHWVWWMGFGEREVEKVESSDMEKVEKRMIEEV